MVVKLEKEFKYLSESGAILASVMEKLKSEVRPGVALNYLDRLAYGLISKAGARPAFLGYRPDGAKKPYPASICASVNEVVVHGLPTAYKLKEGDILKLDLGVDYKGFFTDAAATVGVGKISSEAADLIKAADEALDLGIRAAVEGNTTGDIGFAIEKIAEERGFKVIRGLTGHGLGRKLHEPPTVYNFGKSKQGFKLVSGLVLAIEPMLAVGAGGVKQLPDDSFVTENGGLSAHFEHTIIVGERPAILTRPE